MDSIHNTSSAPRSSSLSSTRLARLPPWLAVAALVSLGAVLRLLAMPWSDVLGGDAAARIQIAEDWLRNPHFITHGYWGPLHFYLLAAVLKLSGGDWRISPIVLNIVLSVATIPPFYGLVRLMFDRRLAGLTALVFTLYPVAFQNSLTAFSETLFIFLVVCALYFVARARSSVRGWHAFCAGVFLTLASMVRYEGWVLGFMLVPLVPGFRHKAMFLVCALLHPFLWMCMCLQYYGDPFYGFNFSRDYVAETMGFSQGANVAGKLFRAVSFPLLLVMGLSPPVFLLCMAGVLRSAWRGMPTRLWLIPLVGITGLFVWRSFAGESVPRPSYSILLAALLLPMLAGGGVLLQERLKPRLAEALLCTLVLLMMPLAYVPYQSLPVVGHFINRSVPANRSVRPIPRVMGRYESHYRLVLPVLQSHVRGEPEACITDFMGWDATGLLTLSMKLPSKRLFAASGEMRAMTTTQKIAVFVERNPRGLLVLREGSRFSKLFRPEGGQFLIQEGMALNVQEVVRVLDVGLYEYQRDR